MMVFKINFSYNSLQKNQLVTNFKKQAIGASFDTKRCYLMKIDLFSQFWSKYW